MPKTKKAIDWQGVSKRLGQAIKTVTTEQEMGAIADKIYSMALELQPELQRDGVDLYTSWQHSRRYRLFLICFKCCWVWSPVVKKDEELPYNFGLCPNGCNRNGKTAYTSSN
ncbi:MAG: hypothetical protein ACREOW_07625 [Thermodesulfobacteriota bacterium]